MRPITRTVGPGAAANTPSEMIRLDEWADAPLGIQVSVQGVVTYTVEHSFDDPNDLISPVPFAQMYWGTDLVPLAASGGGGNSITFSMATAPLWMRIVLNSGAGSVKLVVQQYNVVEG
jgi:hypothetical protein